MTAAVARSPGAPRLSARARRALAAWGFALPFVVLFLVFVAGPVLASLGMSFTDLTSRDIDTPTNVELVGLSNYTDLFEDEVFRRALVNTAYFVVVAVPLSIVFGLAAAVALNAGVERLRTFFRVGFYLPVVTSIVAVAVVWKLMLQPDGLVNQMLGWFGIDGPNWLRDERWAMPSLIVMAAWRNMGNLMVIFLAGLQTIPNDLYEASSLDGAGSWSRFRYITLPLLRPTMLFGAVITSIGYLQFFEEPFVMTQGGPLNRTKSLSFFTYEQFGFGRYSFAAAAGYVLFVSIVVLTVLQFRLLRPKT